MTLDDFLTLTLPQRIIWLHGEAGPRGKLSHDKFGDALGGISRQVIISWEKDGVEPQQESRERLAEFSNFPPWAFSRREAEAPAAWSLLRRLEEIAEMAARGFEALGVEPDRLQPHGGAPSRIDEEAQ